MYLNRASTERRDKYTKPVLGLDIFKGYVLCTAEHCSLRSRKPKLYGEKHKHKLYRAVSWSAIYKLYRGSKFKL